MDRKKAQKALRIARQLAKKAKCATDLHNAFFGIGGKFGELFPDRAEREAFAKTPEYQEFVRLRASLRESDLSLYRPVKVDAMPEYHAAYYPIEDGWFMARVLDFPGVISEGKSIDHARKMIKDALCMMAEHKLDKGEPLPRPNPPPVRDKKAVLVESINLKIRAKVAAAQ